MAYATRLRRTGTGGWTQIPARTSVYRLTIQPHTAEQSGMTLGADTPAPIPADVAAASAPSAQPEFAP